MKTKINNIIDRINSELDYVLNNTDYTTRYDVLINDHLVYIKNGDNDFSVLTNVLDEYGIDYSQCDIEALYDEFATDCAVDITYVCSDISVLNLGYEADNRIGALFSFSIGEIEIDLFEFQLTKSPFKSGIIKYIERETDITINNGDCAYIDLSEYSVCYLADKNYLIELVENHIVEVKAC